MFHASHKQICAFFLYQFKVYFWLFLPLVSKCLREVKFRQIFRTMFFFLAKRIVFFEEAARKISSFVKDILNIGIDSTI